MGSGSWSCLLPPGLLAPLPRIPEKSLHRSIIQTPDSKLVTNAHRIQRIISSPFRKYRRTSVTHQLYSQTEVKGWVHICTIRIFRPPRRTCSSFPLSTHPRTSLNALLHPFLRPFRQLTHRVNCNHHTPSSKIPVTSRPCTGIGDAGAHELPSRGASAR